MSIETQEIESGIVCVTINNPSRRNALSRDMFETLAGLWPRLAQDPSIRAIIVRGAGGDAFCAGAALTEDTDRLADVDDLVNHALLKTQFFPKPLIAAIEGACVAGGLELALSCDLRIAAEDAMLGFPEVRWGIMPSGGGAMKLSDEIGKTRALDLLLTGRLITGAEALAVGLVSETTAKAEVWLLALSRARQIAGNSPGAVRATKQAVMMRSLAAWRASEEAERALVAELRRSGDPETGKAAFRAKRTPLWT